MGVISPHMGLAREIPPKHGLYECKTHITSVQN